MNWMIFSDHLHGYADDLLYLIGQVYLLNLVNWICFRGLFNFLGIHPRKLIGLPGILFSPFLHGSSEHFLMNAIPFFALSLMMLAILDWDSIFLYLQLMALIGGGLTWLVGRKGIHIGASGLVTGMFGWILYWTAMNPSLENMIILSVLLLYFGGIFLGIVPIEGASSWEGHLMGLIAGIICAKYAQPMEYYLSFLETVMTWQTNFLNFIESLSANI